MVAPGRPGDTAGSELKSLVFIAYRYGLLILLFVAFSMAGGYLHYKLLPKYKAAASIYIQSSEGSPLMSIISQVGGSGSAFSGDAELADKFLKVIRSKVFYDFLDQEVKSNPEAFDEQRKKLMRAYRKGKFFKDKRIVRENMTPKELISFMSSRATFKKLDYDIIGVVVIDQQAESSVIIANFLMEMAKRAIVAFESKELEEAENYLTSELNFSKVRLQNIYTKLKRLEDKKHKASIINRSKGESSERVMDRLEEEVELTQVKISQNRLLTTKIKNLINKELGREPSQAFDQGTGQSRLTAQLRALGEENEFLIANLRALKGRLGKIRPRSAIQFGQKTFEYEKQLEVEHDLQKMLWKNLFDAKVQKITIENRIRVHGQASLGATKRKTALGVKLIFSLVASFIFISLGVFIWEHLHPVITSREQLVELGLGYLGSIPVIKPVKRRLKAVLELEEDASSDLLFNPGNHTESALAFHYARARLEKVLNEQNVEGGRVVCILSPMAGEGKSVVASNLAQSFASTGQRTLLLDFDFRKSTLRNIFGLKAQLGAGDFLRGGLKLKQVLQKDVRPNLDFVEAGTMAMPKADIISDNLMREFLGHVRKGYDTILIDTPAFLSGPAGLVVAEASDVPLMVVNATSTRKQEVFDVVDTFMAHSNSSVYVILNRLRSPFTRNPYRSYVVPEGEVYAAQSIPVKQSV